jgi:hypothetical protein
VGHAVARGACAPRSRACSTSPFEHVIVSHGEPGARPRRLRASARAPALRRIGRRAGCPALRFE